MALATTFKYEELILEVEFVASSGTYTPICGLIDVTVNRTANVDEAEIPDCDDESLPLSIEKQVRSIDVSVSGTGISSLEAQDKLKDWFYSSATKNARIRNSNVQSNGSSGDTYIESGPALLTSLTEGRTKGQKVSTEIEMTFDGTPTRTSV